VGSNQLVDVFDGVALINGNSEPLESQGCLILDEVVPAEDQLQLLLLDDDIGLSCTARLDVLLSLIYGRSSGITAVFELVQLSVAHLVVPYAQ
jgi:hypothetical protein